MQQDVVVLGVDCVWVNALVSNTTSMFLDELVSVPHSFIVPSPKSPKRTWAHSILLAHKHTQTCTHACAHIHTHKHKCMCDNSHTHTHTTMHTATLHTQGHTRTHTDGSWMKGSLLKRGYKSWQPSALNSLNSPHPPPHRPPHTHTLHTKNTHMHTHILVGQNAPCF